ncbi:MAG: CHAT domain-containing protein (plasmid) [Phormidium sp.]
MYKILTKTLFQSLKNCKRLLWRSYLYIAVGFFTVLLLLVLPIFARSPYTTVVMEQASASERSPELGIKLYEEGRYQEAIELWQQQLRNLTAQGLILPQAVVLNYLSSAYQDLAEWQLANTSIERSIKLLETQNNQERSRLSALAQALNTKGRLQLKLGNTELALVTWRTSQSLYQKVENQRGVLGSQINQVQALRIMGQYRNAYYLLREIASQLQELKDVKFKASGLRSLGNVLQLIGDSEQAIAVLQQSFTLKYPEITNNDRAATLLNLGNIARNLQATKEALNLYQKAIELASDPLLKTKAQLNQLSLIIEEKSSEIPLTLIPQIKAQIANLSPSRSSVYLRVNLAESLTQLAIQNPGNSSIPNWQEIADDLATAIKISRSLSDELAQAYALNQLSQIYEYQKQNQEAKRLAQQALQIAQNKSANQLIISSARKIGRIYRQENKRAEALVAYQEAFNAIQTLRNDIITANREIQLDFSESIEPIHREFVDLLLQENSTQEQIKMAREVIQALQLAELDNFFKDTCLNVSPVRIDKVDPTAAIIYPIFLSDRLEVIVSIPQQPLQHYATRLPKTEIDRTLQKLYSSFNLEYSDKERLRYSQEVYNWLIKPIKAQLDSNGIKTLVFVLDGFLRNIPIAGLHDGKQYLIEQYAVALSSGLHLLSPQTLPKGNINLLTAGLTEGLQGFAPLPAVAYEMKEIADEINSHPTILLNNKFTRLHFKTYVKKENFNVIHLATHGQFSSNPEETFLLTWDGRINVKELDELLQVRNRNLPNPLQLLVLSACQTAQGDRRAALGLAGMALRSGARSTLATLWSVRDESTAQLMIDFYRQLTKDSLTKAEALRQAQLTLLSNSEYKHPFFWAPFVLIGNWL